MQLPSKPQTQNSNRFLTISLITGSIFMVYLILSLLFTPNENIRRITNSLEKDLKSLPAETRIDHIVFGIASNRNLWPQRKDYVRLWWRPRQMRGCVFLEKNENNTVSSNSINTTTTPSKNRTVSSKNTTLLSTPRNFLISNQNVSDTLSGTESDTDPDLPPVCISEDTSRFPYTYWGGLRSAIRVARAVTETVLLNHTNVRWFVFGDDDTIFFPDNLVKTLSKYDHRLWYYVGANSESFMQNKFFSFNMAYGGAGFAISYPLAKVLTKVFDSCLERYPHLYGSDARISSCLAELGVGLTQEPGFHQMDIRGDMFGLLAAHPLTPVISLHHLETTDPIFPNMNTTKALHHLLRASAIDPHRLLQQSVCYDSWFTWTISVSWGYAIQVFDSHVYLPDALRARETFRPWKRGTMFNIDSREDHSDPCRRPTVFFLDQVEQGGDGVIRSVYKRYVVGKCGLDMASPRKLDEVRVFSRKLEIGVKQLQAPRRHCCDVLPSTAGRVMDIAIRECKEDELIYLHTQ
ncbi:hypothetical protein LguiA_022675 [Lonicera macranthoides]